MIRNHARFKHLEEVTLAGIGLLFVILMGMELLGQEENRIKPLIGYLTCLMLELFLMDIEFFIAATIHLVAILAICFLVRKRIMWLTWYKRKEM